MRKIIGIFIIGVLIMGLSVFYSCHCKPVYTGKLKEIEVIRGTNGFWGEPMKYKLIFEDGRIFFVTEQPPDGFQIGAVYKICRPLYANASPTVWRQK